MSATNSGGIFGSKSAESVAPGSTAQTASSIFTKSAADSSTSIFGKAGATIQSGTGLLGKPKDNESDGLASTITSSNTPTMGTQSQTATMKPSIFSGMGGQSLAGGQSTQASSM